MGWFQRPLWLCHRIRQGQPHILSIDVQPVKENPRIATCGYDGIVRIWFLATLESQVKEAENKRASTAGTPTLSADEACQKDSVKSHEIPKRALASSLSYHSRTANIVRWSPDGQILASAGDDFFIFLYHKEPGEGYAPFGSTEPPPVENWRGHKLGSHANDVLGVAWSPCGKLLASCSVDNKIKVWNVKTDTCIACLQGHESFVKGLCYDPTGRFIASQGEDLTLIIWRTSDWRIEKEIKEPFRESKTSEYQKSLFFRLDWSPCGRELVCSNCLAVKGEKKRHVAPLFLRETNFESYYYFVASNGPVLCARYSPRLYKCFQNQEVSATNASYTVLALGTEDKLVSVWVSGRSRPLAIFNCACDGPVVDISWSADGYKLIAASIVGPPFCYCFTPEELGFTLSKEEEEEFFHETRGKLGADYESIPLPQCPVQLKMERIEEHPKQQENGISTMHDTSSIQHNNDDIENEAAENKLNKQQEVRIGKKRRILPTCLSSDKATGQLSNHFPLSEASKYNHIDTSSDKMMNDNSADTKSYSPMKCAMEEKQTSCQSEEPDRKENAVEKEIASLKNYWQQMKTVGPTLAEAWLTHSEDSSRDEMMHRRLPCFPMAMSSKRIIDESSQLVLHSENEELYCTCKDEMMWQTVFGRNQHAIALAGDQSSAFAVMTSDNALHLLSSKGIRIYPPILFGQQPHLLEVINEFLVIILITGEVSLYYIPQVSLMLRTSIWPIVPQEVNDKSSYPIFYRPFITQTGDLCLTLYSGRTCLFQRSVGNWICIADDTFCHSEFFHLSFSNSNTEHDGVFEKRPLTWFRKVAGKLSPTVLRNARPTTILLETIAHLESMMASARMLHSKDEFRKLMVSYIEKLSSSQADDLSYRTERLKQVLDDILFAENGFFSANCDAKAVKGLLRDILLPLIARNRHLQSLVEEYTEKLKHVEI
eukprot:jgi/Galph1/5773/GphlegSOOS_G4365.1